MSLWSGSKFWCLNYKNNKKKKKKWLKADLRWKIIIKSVFGIILKLPGFYLEI